jgi:hypothetical protein
MIASGERHLSTSKRHDDCDVGDKALGSLSSITMAGDVYHDSSIIMDDHDTLLLNICIGIL